MTEELASIVAEFTKEPQTYTSSPIHVSKAEYATDFFFNYPDIFTLAYGSKSNASAVFDTLYNEPATAVSQITLHPRIKAFSTMWTMMVIGGIFDELMYLDVSYLDIAPLKVAFSFPNYLTGDTATITSSG